MKLEFLGTGAADFNLERDQHTEGFRRFSSALLDDKLLLDPGPHIFHYMETYKKPDLFDKLEYVLITHSHGDHMDMNSVRRIHEMRPNCRFFGSEATARSFWGTGIPFTAILPCYDYQVGEYWVTPLRSNHGAAFDELTYVYSIVDTDGKKLFYGTDTGLLPSQTWQYIYRKGYDIFIMDLTMGDYPDAPNLCEHMTIPTLNLFLNLVNRKKMMVNEKGRFLVTHMAKNWHKPHAELAEQLAPMNVTPAYDGMIVEV